jgi:hypothetical protein
MKLRTDPITTLLLVLILLALVANLVRPFFVSKEVYADSAVLQGGYIGTESSTLYLWKIEGERIRLIARAEALNTNVTRGETSFRVTRGVEELR